MEKFGTNALIWGYKICRKSVMNISSDLWENRKL